MAVFFVSQSARAQAITIGLKDTLPRVDVGGGTPTPRNPSLNPYGISLDDCRADLRINFPLTITGYVANDAIEVWASDSGANCTDPVQRTSATAQCYNLNANVPLTPNPTISIPVKAIIAGKSATLDADGCRRVNATTVSVQFLFFRGGNTGNATTSDTAPIKVDTQGPTGLTGLKVLPGDTRLEISWDAVGEGGVEDVIGVKAFCDGSPTPASGTTSPSTVVCDSSTVTVPDDSGDADATITTTVDGGCVEVEGGTSGGGKIPAQSGIKSPGIACSPSAFAPGDGGAIVPDSKFSAQYECGSVTGTSASIIASSVGGKPLLNGTTYAVAVAATDSYGNLGELSSPICQFPEPTTDFWKDYRGGGGDAGGGFCSTSGVGLPMGSTCVLSLVGLLTLSALRKRRRI